jgi:hypothetical protein
MKPGRRLRRELGQGAALHPPKRFQPHHRRFGLEPSLATGAGGDASSHSRCGQAPFSGES